MNGFNSDGTPICKDIPLSNLLETAQNYETIECHRSEITHSIVSTCPAGRKLIACSGGPGDIKESDEAFWVVPNYSANTCTLVITKPACTTGLPHSYQRVIATCYEVN